MLNTLRRLDLNLLLTLDALLAEQHVTRAAERLHLSQPTVSTQLAKLRVVFDDPLLLAGPRGMRPTARAEALREPLHAALAALDQAIGGSVPFDPARAEHVWRIAATDYGAASVVLPALPRLRDAAPGARLALRPLRPAEIARQTEQGEIDIALHIAEEAPTGLRFRALFAERYVLAGRRGHPGLRRRPSRAQFCRLEQAIVSADGGFRGVTDAALAALGLARRVVLSVPHFRLLEDALAHSDLVAMLPSRLVRDHPALCVTEAPVDVPGFEMVMLWHERLHRDPAQQWLRERIVASLP
ncbi:DNA-binding transcriptional regulator, LysR family [Chitinasiproducens palmae]|uniref:DNA-binding transcriptional regulator, LysR family n=2 Tax=Chitinasiproducens palmae TaxID=1770053 RepID=A0A1H2PK77_9BURK|nr:DNA-binding transcriptional regulator, LysR family [Chitinasiproducens palmae]